jgi:Putative phage metallopeptidase
MPDDGEEPARFFLIELPLDVWNALPADSREALLDHELCHCLVDEDPQTGALKPKLAGHDLEEFVAVVRRHGLWKPDVEAMAKAALGTQMGTQLTLDEQ